MSATVLGIAGNLVNEMMYTVHGTSPTLKYTVAIQAGSTELSKSAITQNYNNVLSNYYFYEIIEQDSLT
jgi:hypothetical protein